MRYSQSFFKDFYGDTCGLVLQAKYVDGTFVQEETDAMRKGKIFEYLASGYIRKGEEPPEPDYYKRDGDGYKKGDMKPEYVTISNHATRFKELATRMFPNMKWGVRYEYKDFSGIFDGVDDDNIIDLKCSDLIDDKWKPTGWHISRWHRTAEMLLADDLLDVLKFNPLLWQPLHYCWLFNKKHRKYPYWLFYVIHPKSDDVLFYELKISDSTHRAYDYLLPQIKNEVDMLLNTGGFTPTPSYNRCNKCELKETCKMCFKQPEVKFIIL